MYAIVKIAGRQYRAVVDQQIEVDRLHIEPGETMTVEDVMLVSDGDKTEVGNPTVPYKVNLELIQHDRRPKVLSVTFKRRGGMRRTHGHRQPFSIVKVTSIVKGG